jgi:uncharacterized damage-inducible protein DinB
VDPGIRFIELLQYTETETQRWKEWFAAHPDALERTCDIAMAGTVRGLLLHIFATELSFAHKVLELADPEWQKLSSSKTVDELFAISENAQVKFAEFVAKAQPADWNEIKDLRGGQWKASKRKMVAQALLHGIHHRGQLATYLRQQGFGGMWMHDLLLTNVMP